MKRIDYLLQNLATRNFISSDRDIEHSIVDYHDDEVLFQENEKRRKFEEEEYKYFQEWLSEHEVEEAEEIEEIEKKRKFEEECSRYIQEQLLDYEIENEIENEIYLEDVIELAESKNNYIKALKKIYENREQDFDKVSKYIYMYEVYDTLKEILYSIKRHDDECKKYIIELIKKLKNEFKMSKVYNIDYDKFGSLFSELESLSEFIQNINFESEFVDPEEFDIAAKETLKIIFAYFFCKQKKYANNRSSKYKKRSERKIQYLKLYNRGYKKCEIAKIMGVKPSAVTKFFKRNNIK